MFAEKIAQYNGVITDILFYSGDWY